MLPVIFFKFDSVANDRIGSSRAGLSRYGRPAAVRSIAVLQAVSAHQTAPGQNRSVGSGYETKLHAIIDQLTMDSDSK